MLNLNGVALNQNLIKLNVYIFILTHISIYIIVETIINFEKV